VFARRYMRSVPVISPKFPVFFPVNGNFVAETGVRSRLRPPPDSLLLRELFSDSLRTSILSGNEMGSGAPGRIEIWLFSLLRQ
jgi:hypothetical protein